MLNGKKLFTKILTAILTLQGKHSGWNLKTVNISNNGSANIHIDSATRGFMFLATSAVQQVCILSVGANSAGSVGHSVRVPATNSSYYTFTSSTNNFKIEQSTGAMVTVFYLTS